MVDQGLINIITIVVGLIFISALIYYIYRTLKNRKKTKSSKAKEQERLSEDYKYKVEIATVMGQSLRIVKTFPVKKVRTEKGIVAIKNYSGDFEEFFPRDEEVKTNYDINHVKKKIEELKKSKDINKFNIKEQLFKWERIKHLLEFPGGSFIKFDEQGVPTFLFVEHRSVYIPFKYNVSLNHIHAPSEPFVKKVIDFMIEKKTKYQEKIIQFQQLMVTIGLVAMVIMFGMNSLWSYKNYTWADDSNYAKMQKRIDNAPLVCAETYGMAGENFLKSSENAIKATANAVIITDNVLHPKEDIVDDTKKNIKTQSVK